MQKKYKQNGDWPMAFGADREEWLEMLGSNPKDTDLQFVGINRATWQKIIKGKMPKVPAAAHKLASFRRHGHLADLLGSAWSDFFVSGDTLTLPGVKYPLQAHSLRSTWLDLQMLPRLRWELERLRKESEWVDVSPALAKWLYGLGKRPMAYS